MMKRKEQEKNRAPIEPKDQMVGVAKRVSEEYELDEDNSPSKKVATFSTKDSHGTEYNFHVFNKNGKHSYSLKSNGTSFHPSTAFKSRGNAEAEAHAKKVVDLVAAGKHKEARTHLNTHGHTFWQQTFKEEFEQINVVS